MNCTIEHIAADNYVKIVVEGVFSIEEHAECVNELFSSPFWKPGMNLLCDYQNFNFGSVIFEKVRAASENYQRAPEKLGKGKMALVVKTKLGFGIGRQFELISEGKIPREIYVFMDEKEAIDWLLNLPKESKMPIESLLSEI